MLDKLGSIGYTDNTPLVIAKRLKCPLQSFVGLRIVYHCLIMQRTLTVFRFDPKQAIGCIPSLKARAGAGGLVAVLDGLLIGIASI